MKRVTSIFGDLIHAFSFMYHFFLSIQWDVAPLRRSNLDWIPFFWDFLWEVFNPVRFWSKRLKEEKFLISVKIQAKRVLKKEQLNERSHSLEEEVEFKEACNKQPSYSLLIGANWRLGGVNVLPSYYHHFTTYHPLFTPASFVTRLRRFINAFDLPFPNNRCPIHGVPYGVAPSTHFHGAQFTFKRITDLVSLV